MTRRLPNPTHPSGDNHWTRRMPERIVRGTASPFAKLSQAQIEELRERWLEYRPTKARLARRYGVTYKTIHRHLRALGLT